MCKSVSKQGQLDIWKDVLIKNYKSDLFKKASAVPQNDVPYNVQVFELLVAESLNRQDLHTNWSVTQASHDDGIDLVGTDIAPCKTPFTTAQYKLLSVGQVKRSKRSYKYEDLRTDIRKARGYWINSDLFNGNSPKQFLFILSTEGKNGISVLKKHLQEDLALNADSQLKNDQLAHVQLIDAAHIIKSWKLDLSYYEKILEDALSPEQLACFHKYVSELDCSWLSVSVQAPKSGGIGEAVTFSLLIEPPSDELTLTLFARWCLSNSDGIQLLHPLRMIAPRVLGTIVRIKGQAEIQITLRSMQPGMCDFGRVELYSQEQTLIASASLGTLNVYDGFCPVYFSQPNHTVLEELKRYVYDTTQTLIPVAISGCGGIGKSSLISEIMVIAAQKGYLCYDLVQPKDLLHSRSILCRLFAELIRPNIPHSMFLPDIPSQLQTYMGINYRLEWESDLKNFFYNSDQEVNLTSIIQCLVTLLLGKAQEGPVFLWMSNMHWASKETMNILRIAIDELTANQELLEGRILWIFEGRSGEILFYERQTYYPVDWERFLTNSFLHTHDLAMWNREDCQHFLQQLFVESKSCRSFYYNYFDKLINCTCGIPMQMLEMIRIHLEQDILYVDPTCNYRLRIQHHLPVNIRWLDSLTDIIDRRIFFYRKKCSDLVDFCIILAALDETMPTLLADRLIKWLHTKQTGIDEIIFQSGFLVENRGIFSFSHEYYQSAFGMQPLESLNLLSQCLTFYTQIPCKNIKDRYAEIKLKLLDPNANLVQLRQSIIILLDEKVPKAIEQSLYRLLLQLPPLPKGPDISHCTALFMLCESYIQKGSWKAGQDCLEQLLAIPLSDGSDDLLVYIKAYQELSNILADRLSFDRAIQVAEDGLELVEMYLEFHSSDASQYNALCVEREKLLARLAVCHWFSGDIAKGITLQRKCYDLAVSRHDEYSAGHVLYEIGTLVLHFNLQTGITLIENVLTQCKNIPSLDKSERTLIGTQLLMGKLCQAVRSNDHATLRRVKLGCRCLLEADRFSPHSYERFLCLTMHGICVFLLEHDIKKAQDSFFESLRCAVESDMKNLEWKALLHITQMCALDQDAELMTYAKAAIDQVENAIKENPQLENRLRKMFKPVLTQLTRLMEGKSLLTPLTDLETMISVYTGGCLFVIMN